MSRLVLVAGSSVLVMVAAGVALAQSAPKPTVPEVGNLGAVVYSVLPPSKFRELNGSGWASMDGQKVTDSDLCKEAGVCTLPDARGVFVRVLNQGRDVGTGDPDGNRQMGAAQSDALKSHMHWLNHSVWVALQWAGLGWGNRGGEHPLNAGGRAAGDMNPQWLRTVVQEGGASETRPRNIALYLYIRVNR